MLRFLPLLVLAVAVGCQTTTDEGFITFKDPHEFHRFTTGLLTTDDVEVDTAKTNNVENAASTAKVPQMIAIGAKLSIYVDEDSSLDRQLVVPPSGVIEFPPLGRIPVEGISTEDLRQQIARELERDYFQTATVTVTMERTTTTTEGGVIYLLGSIGRRGPMAIPPGEEFTVTKVMLAAGGGGSFSDLSRVEIIRYGADGRKYKTAVNVQRIINRGEFDQDIPVRHGDWLKIPEKILNF